MDFKKKIEEKGLNKSWLARKLNIKQSTFASYISGARTMPLDVEEKLKEALK